MRFKMPKSITKEQIIDLTLELINQNQGLRNVNLREIARVLGCAHTNLYNYFQDFEQLLWKSHETALLKMGDYVTADLDKISDIRVRLQTFFTKFIDFYLQNKGWFKLIWFEKLVAPRPEENIETGLRVVNSLIRTLTEIYSDSITLADAHYILHNVHCYLHGEVSIFIAGRGLRKDEPEFCSYVTGECMKLIELYVASTSQTPKNPNPTNIPY